MIYALCVVAAWQYTSGIESPTENSMNGFIKITDLGHRRHYIAIGSIVRLSEKPTATGASALLVVSDGSVTHCLETVDAIAAMMNTATK